MHGLAIDHGGGHGEIAVARIGRRADIGLINRLARHLAHRHHVVGAARRGDQRLELREIDLVLDVVGAAVIGAECFVGVRPPVIGEEALHRRVGREDRGGRAELGAHVGDHVAVHGGEPVDAGAVILDDLTDPALDRMAAQHFEDHVLGADPVGQLAGQPDAHHLGHADRQRIAGHHRRHLDAAGADRQHAQRAGRRGVGIGTHQEAAGDAQPLHMHRVGNAVAGAREMRAEAPRRALQEQVVVGVLEIRLDQVVIDVLAGHVDLDAVEPHGLQRQHSQGRGGVLQQHLIGPEADLGARRHVAVDQGAGDQLAGEVLGGLGHGASFAGTVLRIVLPCCIARAGLGKDPCASGGA